LRLNDFDRHKIPTEMHLVDRCLLLLVNCGFYSIQGYPFER
jgi:hypothetical protein